MKTKKIVNIEVVEAGSPPDVDSDFSVAIREKVKEYVSDVYGKNNVSEIITFGTLAAKAAFKEMCTIYNVPFAQANKITSYIPKPEAGVNLSLTDIFNPEHPRYGECAEFREAVSGKEWQKILEGAKAIENRIKSTGVHACGILISQQPLYETIPMQVRQKDEHVVSQWVYKECEELGLIKFDFLGLDTVDIVQHTVENIIKNGKTPPNMLDIIHGDMDDKDTYELFQSGNVLGVFQFGTDLVMPFCKIIKPTKFENLVATTALCRPGPMKDKTHISYANRKNGLEKIELLHKDFINSPLEEILKPTYGLIVYQEQVMKIANEISGMTLKEADKFRSAMGKKKKDVMDAMMPKFIDGGIKNGYSEEAMLKIWHNIEGFAQYAFNKSHSVAYAMLGYQTAYLKVHYPVEFMSALLSQKIGDKDEILKLLRECNRMKIKVGPADINLSETFIAPDYKNISSYDIIYGLSGIDAVSENISEIIVNERNNNGEYKDIEDFANRCYPLGVNNKKIYENLCYAGSFDSFGYSRQAIVESIPSIINEIKTKNNLGESLFDMFDLEDNSSSNKNNDYLNKIPEYPYVKKLQKEANVVGLYLTSHPLNNIGIGTTQGKVKTINKILSQNNSCTTNIIASVTEIQRKTLKSSSQKVVSLTLEDTSGSFIASLSREIINGIEKKNAQDRIKRAYLSGNINLPDNLLNLATLENTKIYDDVEKNNVYLLNITYKPIMGDKKYMIKINDIKPLLLCDNGKLPIRIRVKLNNKEKNEVVAEQKIIKYLQKIEEQYSGDYEVHLSFVDNNNYNMSIDEKEYYSNLVNSIKENIKKDSLPVPVYKDNDIPIAENELSNNIEYKKLNIHLDKNNSIEEILGNKFGIEKIDFGIFNYNSLEEG